jgi:GMP synthase (glutamine-hydrolysing)
MKLLVVEGNNEETRAKRGRFGIPVYSELFRNLLENIDPNAKVEIAFPTDADKSLPTKNELEDYDGILWTGSSLSVLDVNLFVQRQLDFAEKAFESGVPIYGSCWGLQVATVVAGGSVIRSAKGLEFGITEPIELTESGAESPFYAEREKPFTAFCIHFDTVDQLPENTEILAFNSHSKVQAMQFLYKKSHFFGVQYHPEFRCTDMALIASFLKSKLVASDVFGNEGEVMEFYNQLMVKSQLPREISEYEIHSQEIKNWLLWVKNKSTLDVMA